MTVGEKSKVERVEFSSKYADQIRSFKEKIFKQRFKEMKSYIPESG